MKAKLFIAVMAIMLVMMMFCRADTAEYTFQWTAPADNVGVTGYEIRACFVSDTTEFDWNNPDLSYPLSMAPQAPGATEQYSINDLPFETPLVFAIKSYDGRGNWSGISNKLYLFFEDSEPPQAIVDLR